jgi:hypothetical protein
MKYLARLACSASVITVCLMAGETQAASSVPDNCNIDVPPTPGEIKIEIPKPFAALDDLLDGYCKMQTSFHKPVTVTSFTVAGHLPDGKELFVAGAGLNKKQFADQLIGYFKKNPMKGERLDRISQVAGSSIGNDFIPREMLQLTVHEVEFAGIKWDITARYSRDLNMIVAHLQNPAYQNLIEADLPITNGNSSDAAPVRPQGSTTFVRRASGRFAERREAVVPAVSAPAVHLFFPYVLETLTYKSVDPSANDGRGVALFTQIANKYNEFAPKHPFFNPPMNPTQVLALRTDGIVELRLTRNVENQYGIIYHRDTVHHPGQLSVEYVAGQDNLSKFVVKQAGSYTPDAAAKTKVNNPF